MEDNKTKMNRGTLAGIVLAAGMSSRMGDFKPLMKVGGKPMIQRAVDMMQQAGASPIIVVTGRCAESLMAELKNEDVLFVHNTDYEHTQMFDSLLLGIHALPESAERILMSPVDVPVVNRKTVEELLNSPGMFVRPVFRGTPGHPVVFSRELVSKMERYRGDFGMRGFLEENQISITDVAVDDMGIAFDADTMQDYERIVFLFRMGALSR